MSPRRVDRRPPSKRGDDVTIVFPFGWGSYEGSGRLLVLILIALGLLAVSLISSAVGVWHDRRVAADHAQVLRAIYLQTYVMSLSEERKKQLDLQEPDEVKQWRRWREEQKGEAR